MDIAKILAAVDHTLLDPAADWEAIRALCDDGMRYHTASVCIPPNLVARAANYVQGQLPICTVIGFPCGTATTAVKCFETADAVKDGSLAIGNMLNAAYALGLGGRWINRADGMLEDELGKELMREAGYDPEQYIGVGNVIVGYPANGFPEAIPHKDNYYSVIR